MAESSLIILLLGTLALALAGCVSSGGDEDVPADEEFVLEVTVR